MTNVSRIQRLAIAGTIALSGVIGATSLAAAQDEPDFDPDYYESALTGYEIEISGNDFEIDDVIVQEYDDGENEQVYIESDFSSTQVSFFDDSDDPEDTIELWLSDIGEGTDTLEVVDNGEDGDVVWYYAEGVYDDLDFVYYIQVTEDVDGNVDVLESVLTLDGGLVDAIDAAQQDITIDGEAFMDDVDLDELGEFLDGGTFRGGDDSDNGDDDQNDDGNQDRDQDEDDDSSTTRSRDRLPAGDDEDEEEDNPDDTNGTDDSGTGDDEDEDTGN